MIDFYINPATGDLDLTGEGLRLTRDTEIYIQRVQMALKLNLAEFFTHINYGLPWLKNPEESVGENLRYFLGDTFPNTANFLYTELDTYIKRFPFVISVDSTFSFDQNTRTFRYSVIILNDKGETITLPPYTTTL